MNQPAAGYTQGKEIFKDYVLKGFLGKGGYGTVYHVQNGAGISFALKVLQDGLKMEQQGFEAVKGVSSFRLVKVLDFGQTVAGDPCFLMEYVKTSLASVLERSSRLEEKEAVRLFAEILKGLRVLEANGIIHRDIKPANLFVSEEIVKVGDFGSAKFTSGDSTKMSRAPGSIHYMAPERFKKGYGFSVDRWAAAAIFYEMLTGKHAFDGDDDTEIFGAIMQEEPDFSVVPARYRAFFSQCFVKKADGRHGDVGEMAAAFVEAAKGGKRKPHANESMQVAPPNVEAVKAKNTLRREPATVSEEEFKKVFGLKDDWRPLAYIGNDYVDNRDGTVTDRATGLTWEQSGSKKYMSYTDAEKYVAQLNRERFAGHSDWRLPTVPELMSLIEPIKKNGSLYIDPVFDDRQLWCWSSDKQSRGGAAWGVGFLGGGVGWHNLHAGGHVRAVRP